MNTESKVFTIDGGGNASGRISIDVPGQIYAIDLDYAATAATTDVTITGGSGEPVLSRANSSTNDVFYPRLPAHKPDATASTLTEVAAIEKWLDVVIAQGTAAGTVTVTVYVLTD